MSLFNGKQLLYSLVSVVMIVLLIIHAVLAARTPQIVYDIQTMRSKGFGFVNYANYGDATAAIAAMNGYVMGARTLQVSFKKSK
jgi:RNA recognition motif-containing protein